MFTTRELNVLIELWCAAFCVLSLLCIRLFFRSERWYRSGLMLMFLFVFASATADIVAETYDGQPGAMSWYMCQIFNTLVYWANFASAGAFTAYICARLEREHGDLDAWGRISWAACAVGMVLTAFGLFFVIDPAHNTYVETPYYWISQAIGTFVQLGNFVVLLARRKSVSVATFTSMVLYTLLPVPALVAQTYVPAINFLLPVTTVSLMVVFFDLQTYTAEHMVAQRKRLAQQERELADSRVQVMVSQIQPHFLYNTLDAIYYLCRKDPEQAREAISRFSDYLRANLRSLSADKPVPLDTELSHVENYLELERMSSDDTIDFELDVQARSFMLPALSLQPLVENAVKHGITKREGGGTVRLSTREEDDCFVVTVEDDGVGFDTTAEPDTSRPHVGMQNVRQRVETMCGGTLTVQSTPGVGTTSVIRIPKGR